MVQRTMLFNTAPHSILPGTALPPTRRSTTRERKSTKAVVDKAKESNVDASVSQALAFEALTTAQFYSLKGALSSFRKSVLQSDYDGTQYTYPTDILKQPLQILEPCKKDGVATQKQLKYNKPPLDGSADVRNRFLGNDLEIRLAL